MNFFSKLAKAYGVTSGVIAVGFGGHTAKEEFKRSYEQFPKDRTDQEVKQAEGLFGKRNVTALKDTTLKGTAGFVLGGVLGVPYLAVKGAETLHDRRLNARLEKAKQPSAWHYNKTANTQEQPEQTSWGNSVTGKRELSQQNSPRR